MDQSTPPHQISKPKDRPLSLKKIKIASRSRLSLGSVSPKWRWNKSSPTAVNTASTLPDGGDGSPNWKYMTKRDDGSSRNGVDSSGFANALDYTSPKFTSRRKSVDSVLSVDAALLNEKNVTTATVVQHEERDPNITDVSNIDTIAISDVALTVAIDCSGSTRGKVLEEEKGAIQSISKVLSQEAQDRVVILPWNDGAESTLSLQEMDEIWSYGGTDPTALLRDRHHRQALLNSSLWVLLTDGEIDEFLVRDFAASIGEAGLHGTASIIICVGPATSVPARCNISVGKSVFATVPDCMFLFHDTRTQKVYVLQCKGRFKTLLPDSGMPVFFDEHTPWEDLPQITYEALRDFAIPRKRNLSPDTVILTSGKTFSLSDVYNDTLDASLADEILSNDDDLKTLLLTASTRGRKEEVKRWISKKKLSTIDPMWAPRVDIGHCAFRNLEKLVNASRISTMEDVSALKKELQLAHEANWNKFANTVSTEKTRAKTRDIVIADATARLQLDDRAPASPVCMAPVSPIFSGYQAPSIMTEPFLIEINYRRPTRRQERKQTSPPPPNPGVLFSQGYKCLKLSGHSSSSSGEYFKGSCTMCTRSRQVMALILQKPEDDEPTVNYPEVEQYAKHKYPFVLGNFPDVDIISPEIYCETCSVYLVRHGQTPKAERILGALPLVQTHGKEYRANLQPWTNTLMNAFQGRFHEDIVISVFLSVLYNTLDDLTATDSGENTHLTRAIRWACKNLLQSLEVPGDTTSIPFGESTPRGKNSLWSTTSSATLAETIPGLLKDALRGYGPLLSYPLDGFLVLMLAARDIDNENCERESVRCVVWLRFAMHLTEAHYASMRNDRREKANDRLTQILHTQDPEAKPGESTEKLLKKSPIGLASLEGTHLLSSNDLETFQRLGTLFSHIGSKCGPAIAVYLHYLLEYSLICSSAEECFELIRKERALRKLFVAPEEMDPGQAADVIARLHATQKG